MPLPKICGHPLSVHLTSGSGTWTVPAGVTLINVECYGPGGNGGDGNDSDNHYGGSGGGGGGYGASQLSVTPGQTFTYVVGTPGFDTEFDGGTVLGSTGGAGLSDGLPFLQGGGGGVGSGDIAFTGGTGGDSGATNSEIAGGGGGCAGPGGNGGNGGTPSGGASAGGFSGPGGAGGSSSAGTPGFGAGGGGGGGTAFSDPTTFPGGAGANGLIIITYASLFGLNHNYHQTHTTQQTNFSLQSCVPLNQYTTTKGIGMRRKYILGTALLLPPLPPGLSLPCGPTTPGPPED